MNKVLMSVRLDGRATLKAAAKALAIPESRFDKSYGVVEIDPDAKMFAVQVDEDAVAGFATQPGKQDFRGPFANPRIEAFGPVKRG